MQNTEATIAKRNYWKISELGSQLNLSFSSYLVLGTKIIALDGVKRSLLVVETSKGMDNPYIIDLNKIAEITVKKSYGSIRSGQLKKKRIEEFLKNIDLHFKYRDNTVTIIIPFYDSATDGLKDRAALERNASSWQMVLSRMLPKPISNPV
jgi:hypothetical protein